MDLKQLDSKLEKVASDFSSEIRLKYSENYKESATEGDIVELARQTFYALDEYRKLIIEYLSK